MVLVLHCGSVSLCGRAHLRGTLRRSCNSTPSCHLDVRNTGDSILRRQEFQSVLNRRGFGLLTFLSYVSSSCPASSAQGEDDAAELLQTPAPDDSTTSNTCAYKKLSSGLEYCDVVEGTGKAPVKGHVIKLHYTGSMENGKVFDSSFDRGEPLSFQLNAASVMKGVYQAILGSDEFPGMKPGGRRLVRLPPELGYGNNPGMCPRYFSGPCVVPPNSVLIYDLQYLGLWTFDEDTRPFHLFT